MGEERCEAIIIRVLPTTPEGNKILSQSKPNVLSLGRRQVSSWAWFKRYFGAELSTHSCSSHVSFINFPNPSL